MNVGQVCIKLAGRDAGKLAVIVDKIDNRFVLVDGQVRRRKCNVNHLEPTSKSIEISAGASEAQVQKAFEEMGWTYRAETKPKRAAAKPKSARSMAVKEAPVVEKKKPKKAEPKADKPKKETKSAEEKPPKAAKPKKAEQ